MVINKQVDYKFTEKSLYLKKVQPLNHLAYDTPRFHHFPAHRCNRRMACRQVYARRRIRPPDQHHPRYPGRYPGRLAPRTSRCELGLARQMVWPDLHFVHRRDHHPLDRIPVQEIMPWAFPSIYLRIKEKTLSLQSANNGALAERLGTGLQNLLQRFDSARHLQKMPYNAL